MDIEGLTKSQLILLALLVSFVTSIATGIVTVTLLDQAPPGVTQTINRVVEKTVERVVPGEQKASVITKETTVVVKEQNLIVGAVEKNKKHVLQIGQTDETGKFASLGIGFLISVDGYVATDKLNLNESKEYTVVLPSGKSYKSDLLETSSANVALLQLRQVGEGEGDQKFTKSNFAKFGDVRLGQTVVAIGGLSGDSVSTGIVSKINTKLVEEETAEGEEPKSRVVPESVITSVPITSDYSGGILFDVDGFVIGMNLARKDGAYTVPNEIIVDILTKKLENDSKTSGGSQDVSSPQT